MIMSIFYAFVKAFLYEKKGPSVSGRPLLNLRAYSHSASLFSIQPAVLQLLRLRQPSDP